MPPHVQQFQMERAERKRRQEKFTKRTRSLFNKAKLLAKDTDAWVALIIRDRSGQIKSFRSSDSLYWPPSIKDLIVSRRFLSSMILYANKHQKKKHPSGTHEFLEKYAVSGCWKEVIEDESDSALVDGDANALVEDVRAMKVTPAETEGGSYDSITVDLCQVDKQVEVGADTPNEKPVETVEPPEWMAVNALVEPDSTTVNVPRGSNCTTVEPSRESDYTTVDVRVESGNASVNALGKPSNAILDSDRQTHDTIVELGESDNMNVDAVRESKNTTLDVPVESDNATFQVFGESDNVRDTPGEAMAMGVHITEVDLASEYEMMDLDIPGEKSSVGMDVRGRESIDAASALCTMSQHSPQSSGGLGGWQIVNWLKTRQHGQQDQGPKLAPIGIDPKELLEGWDWVFQRR